MGYFDGKFNYEFDPAISTLFLNNRDHNFRMMVQTELGKVQDIFVFYPWIFTGRRSFWKRKNEVSNSSLPRSQKNGDDRTFQFL